MKIRMKPVAAALVVAFSGCGETIAADGDGVPEEAQVSGHGEVDLTHGDRVRFSDVGVSVSFDDVVEDSRCPVHPQIACVWEGNAAIELGVAADDEPAATVVLHSTLDPRSIELHGVRLRLIEVRPVPTDEGPISVELYTVTIEVEPIG